MTNDMNTTTTARRIGRNAGRAVTVVAGSAGALLLWAVNDPWGGVGIAVRQGDTTRHIGPVAVAVTALLAGLAAWGLLALLERSTRHAARTYRIIASTILLISLAGPLGSGIGTSATLALVGMHLTVGTALIIGLPGTRRC